jgi:L-ascorbate metabolism protein UlaG (beta-lactamase superfamily)
MKAAGLLTTAIMVMTLHHPCGAQQVDPLRNYWGDIDAFMNRQAEVTLGLVEETLGRFPPQLPEPYVRRLAMLMLDGVLHDPGAPSRPAVQAFFQSNVKIATDEMESTRTSRGAIVWKLYDHGFVARTRTVTIAFDLIRGYSAGDDAFAMSDELMERIVAQCDALFISHRHGDHADYRVAEMFMGSGKPVVAPVGVWADSALHSQITHFEPESHVTKKLPVRGGAVELDVVIYPGHQGADIPNNVTLVLTPDGVSFCQTGDQSNEDDFEWIDQVGANHQVDILMPNCWTTDLGRLVAGIDPELVITGHENELGHSVDHREPYWLTYDRMSRSPYPFVVMTWGESYHYRPNP